MAADKKLRLYLDTTILGKARDRQAALGKMRGEIEQFNFEKVKLARSA
jgi:hypothetical protein